jgi:hypothetical protein
VLLDAVNGNVHERLVEANPDVNITSAEGSSEVTS